MAVHVKAAVNRVFQEFRTDMLQAFDQAPRIWREYAMEVPSSSRSTLHAWLGDQAAVREWLGSRQSKSMSSRSWEVVNRKWELTYEFERDQIEDDLSGLVQSALVKARSMGEKFARHEDKLVADTLEAGLTSLCWDGQFFFDTDHPIDIDGVTSGTYSNKRTTFALNHANFNTAKVDLMSFKNEDNSPMVMPGGLILLVPPALDLTARQIVESKTLTPAAAIALYGTSGPSENLLAGAARVVVNPFLTSTTRWYLLSVGEFVKPIMLQRRRPLETEEIGQGSELYFQQEKILIGSSARYAASYTLPQLGICADA